jgi:hypothetical protein
MGIPFGKVAGLRYNQKVIAHGAQTERRGDAGPVRSLLGGKPYRPLLYLSDTDSEFLRPPADVAARITGWPVLPGVGIQGAAGGIVASA